MQTSRVHMGAICSQPASSLPASFAKPEREVHSHAADAVARLVYSYCRHCRGAARRRRAARGSQLELSAAAAVLELHL